MPSSSQRRDRLWVLPAFYPKGKGFFSPGLKRSGSETDHSRPTSVEVKKTWIYTSTPPQLTRERENWYFFNVLPVGARIALTDVSIRVANGTKSSPINVSKLDLIDSGFAISWCVDVEMHVAGASSESARLVSETANWFRRGGGLERWEYHVICWKQSAGNMCCWKSYNTSIGGRFQAVSCNVTPPVVVPRQSEIL
jgi:hypothetical protein